MTRLWNRRAVTRLWNLVLEILALGILVGVLLFFSLVPRSRAPETSRMAQKPTLGRIVLYAFIDSAHGNALVERPAEIVSIVTPGSVNLHVKLDGTNDLGLAGVTADDCKRMAFWGTSIAAADNHETAQAGRWRWPPRE